jgi:hypothetical protein
MAGLLPKHPEHRRNQAGGWLLPQRREHWHHQGINKTPTRGWPPPLLPLSGINKGVAHRGRPLSEPHNHIPTHSKWAAGSPGGRPISPFESWPVSFPVASALTFFEFLQLLEFE